MNLDPIDYQEKQAVNKSVKIPSNLIVTAPVVPKTETTFKEETALHRLGYKITGLNRTERWDVLVRKAIPQSFLKTLFLPAQHVCLMVTIVTKIESNWSI